METKSKNSVLPFAAVTFSYFVVGFLTTINEQLQVPLKFAFLSEVGNLTCQLGLEENTFLRTRTNM
jgi:FHS family L-fucose permease-like MFS transporter